VPSDNLPVASCASRRALVLIVERGFHYTDCGSMATSGKSRAVVDVGSLRCGGYLAWLAWMFLHVSVLNRLW
jgi:NADH dehydrogenase FAD-containing subunit